MGKAYQHSPGTDDSTGRRARLQASSSPSHAWDERATRVTGFRATPLRVGQDAESRHAIEPMPSADSAPPDALAALARAARSLRDAPASEQGWRLRRLIGDAARLAAIGGADPLSLAQDAWQAATDASARAATDDTDQNAPHRAVGTAPPDELAARRHDAGTQPTPPGGHPARVLPFGRLPR